MHDADSHIMEEPDWLHPYLDTATRERFPYVWSVGDEPGRQAIDEGARPSRRQRVPLRGRIATDAAQELLGDRIVPERRPSASARSARLLEPVGVRHVHELADPAVRSRRRCRVRGHVGARAAPRDPRLVFGRPALAARHGVARRRHGCRGCARPRSHRRRYRGDPDRSVLHAGSLTESPRPRSGVGDVRGSRRTRAAARRGRGRAGDAACVLRERTAGASPTSTVAIRTSSRSTTCRSRSRSCRR